MEEIKKEQAAALLNGFADKLIAYAVKITEKENATPAELDAMSRIACKILERDLDNYLIY